MKITLILSMLFFAVHSSSYSQEELPVEKKVAVKKLLEMTGMADMVLMFAESMTAQMSALLKQNNPEIPPRAFNILADVVNTTLQEEIEAFYEMVYSIYHEYFTLNELNGLISFYETPLGRKVITTLPAITQESMLAGQQWGATLGPKVEQRLITRLQEAGIE